MKLLGANGVAFFVQQDGVATEATVGVGEHPAHGGDEKGRGAGARVDDVVVGVDVDELGHQFRDVMRCQDDAEGVAV